MRTSLIQGRINFMAVPYGSDIAIIGGTSHKNQPLVLAVFYTRNPQYYPEFFCGLNNKRIILVFRRRFYQSLANMIQISHIKQLQQILFYPIQCLSMA